MASLLKHHTWQELVLKGTITVDWDTDDIKVMLLDDTLEPDETTDDYIADVDTNEISGGGYTAGGAAIDNISVTRSVGVTTVDGDDVTWEQNGSGFTDARYAVVYKNTGSAATSPILLHIDLGTDQSNVAGDFQLRWHANGIFTQE
jgi:hypothetical protein